MQFNLHSQSHNRQNTWSISPLLSLENEKRRSKIFQFSAWNTDSNKIKILKRFLYATIFAIKRTWKLSINSWNWKGRTSFHSASRGLFQWAFPEIKFSSVPHIELKYNVETIKSQKEMGIGPNMYSWYIWQLLLYIQLPGSFRASLKLDSYIQLVTLRVDGLV